jgi:hypothetical protein
MSGPEDIINQKRVPAETEVDPFDPEGTKNTNDIAERMIRDAIAKGINLRSIDGNAVFQQYREKYFKKGINDDYAIDIWNSANRKIADEALAEQRANDPYDPEGGRNRHAIAKNMWNEVADAGIEAQEAQFKKFRADYFTGKDDDFAIDYWNGAKSST